MKNIRYTLLTAFVCIILITSLSAQQGRNREMLNETIGTMTGVIKDAKSGNPIEYANFALFKKRDSSVAAGSVSATDGTFSIKNLSYGFYYAKVTFIGYETKVIDSLIIRPKASDLDLGEILLSAKVYTTGDVVVAGEKDYMVNTLDKKVINVSKDLTSLGGTAVDVMQQIPSVTVDADGGVSLRGSSNITILIDGRPSGLVGLSSEDVLTQIPASSIESIEIVTNPSARYDPEGTSGIINIILKKQGNSGYNGNVQANAGTGDKYNGSLNGNLRFDGVNFFGSYDNRINAFNGTSSSNRVNNINNITTYVNQNGTTNSDMVHQSGNLGFDWYMSEKSTLSLSGNIRNMDMKHNSTMEDRTLDATQSLTRFFDRDVEFERDVISYNAAMNFRTFFASRANDLVVDLSYSDNAMNRDDLTEQKTFSGMDLITPLFTTLRKSFAKNTNKMFVGELNYALPLSQTEKLEMGLKSNIKDLGTRNDYEVFDAATQSWVIQPLQKNYYDYDEQVHAGYATYSGAFSSFAYMAGVRVEQVYSEGKVLNTGQNFEKDYFSVYPSLHLRQDFGAGQELQISYSRRVQRPNNRSLNPFVDYSDSLNVDAGNPDLKPEYSNSLELAYQNFWNKTSFNGTIYYRQTNDVISRVSTLLNNGTTFTKPENIAKTASYGLELVGVHPVADWWRVTANLSYFKTEFDGGTLRPDLTSSNYSWMARLNQSFTPMPDLSMQLMANYRAPMVMAQGKMSEQYGVDVAVKKDFLEGKLSVTFRVSDIFNTRSFDSETIGSNFFVKNYRKMDTRVAFLGISFRFDSGMKIDRERERERKRGEDGDMEDF